MLSTDLEYLCTVLVCFLGGWNAFDRVGIPLYRVGMISSGLECFRGDLEYLCTGLVCFLGGWNAFDRSGIPLYRIGMISTGLECFLECWNAF
jgi:hypothetical protein